MDWQTGEVSYPREPIKVGADTPCTIAFTLTLYLYIHNNTTHYVAVVVSSDLHARGPEGNAKYWITQLLASSVGADVRKRLARSTVTATGSVGTIARDACTRRQDITHMRIVL